MKDKKCEFKAENTRSVYFGNHGFKTPCFFGSYDGPQKQWSSSAASFLGLQQQLCLLVLARALCVDKWSQKSSTYYVFVNSSHSTTIPRVCDLDLNFLYFGLGWTKVKYQLMLSTSSQQLQINIHATSASLKLFFHRLPTFVIRKLVSCAIYKH